MKSAKRKRRERGAGNDVESPGSCSNGSRKKRRGVCSEPLQAPEQCHHDSTITAAVDDSASQKFNLPSTVNALSPCDNRSLDAKQSCEESDLTETVAATVTTSPLKGKPVAKAASAADIPHKRPCALTALSSTERMSADASSTTADGESMVVRMTRSVAALAQSKDSTKPPLKQSDIPQYPQSPKSDVVGNATKLPLITVDGNKNMLENSNNNANSTCHSECTGGAVIGTSHSTAQHLGDRMLIPGDCGYLDIDEPLTPSSPAHSSQAPSPAHSSQALSPAHSSQAPGSANSTPFKQNYQHTGLRLNQMVTWESDNVLTDFSLIEGRFRAKRSLFKVTDVHGQEVRCGLFDFLTQEIEKGETCKLFKRSVFLFCFNQLVGC